MLNNYNKNNFTDSSQLDVGKIVFSLFSLAIFLFIMYFIISPQEQNADEIESDIDDNETEDIKHEEVESSTLEKDENKDNIDDNENENENETNIVDDVETKEEIAEKKAEELLDNDKFQKGETTPEQAAKVNE